MHSTSPLPALDLERKVSVLLLEDEPAAVKILETELEDAPLLDSELTHASTLQEALRLLETRSFDVALLDLYLPDSEGVDTFGRVRQVAPDLPVIVLSGSYDESMARLVLRSGAQDFLQKQHATAQLIGHSIRHAIERHRVSAELTRRTFELELSEIRTRRIIASNVDAILIIDDDGVVRFANPAAATMFGYESKDLVGQPFGFPVISDQVTELDFRRPHGDPGIAELRGVTIEWDGRTAFLATLRDITELKRRNVELQLFRELVDRSNDAFEVIDPETTRFIDVSEKDCHDLGYSRAELLARRVMDIDPTASAEKWSTVLRTLRASGSASGEGIHRRRDGSSFPIEFSARLVRLDREYLVAIVRDITERRKNEARIREQATLLDRASDAIIVRDLDDRVRFWSKGAERIYGWTAEETIGQVMVGRILQDPAVPGEAMAALRETGEWSGELPQRKKDGRELIVQCRWTLLRDDDGQPQSVLSINSDITERKQLETQFFRAQRLESIGTLASGMAHDLNNVLTPILMAVGSLQREAADPETQRTLRLLEASAKRGARLVQQVLAFGRGVESKRITIHPFEIAREIAIIVEDTFSRSIILELVPPRDPWTVLGDPTHLYQILMNLCVNARDAMPDGGKLTVAVENTLLDDRAVAGHPGAKAGPYVVLRVADTGSGMPPEIRDRIFEPFFTTKEVGRGTGLGLSTVLTLTKAHGGFITIDSQVGAGTTFRVNLPATVRAASVAPFPSRATTRRGQGETVLIVDDEEIIRAVTSKLLQKAGYRVLTASNGAEGIALFTREKDRVAVVLSDMSMPIMRGTDLVATLKKIDPAVPIIGMSGRAPVEPTTGPAAKVDRFLPKPFVSETLLQAIHDTIASRPAPALKLGPP